MSGPVVWHIGTMKSGTTYVQNGLKGRRDVLTEHGWLYPGRPGVLNQQSAMYGLLGSDIPWISATEQQRASARALETLQQAREWDGSVLFSAEALSAIEPEAAARTIALMPHRPAHVVITARDLGRIIPSQLQQGYKGGSSYSATEFFAQLKAQRPGRTGAFWRMFDISGLAARWAAVPGVDSVTVVTLPQRGADPGELWTRFAKAVGWTHEALTTPPEIDASESNLSVSAPEARLLRWINRELTRRQASSDEVRALLGRVFESLSQRDPSVRGERLTMPTAWFDQIAEWAADDVAMIDTCGAILVGDPTDLNPRPGSGANTDPTIPSDAERPTLDAAVAAIMAVHDATAPATTPASATSTPAAAPGAAPSATSGAAAPSQGVLAKARRKAGRLVAGD